MAKSSTASSLQTSRQLRSAIVMGLCVASAALGLLALALILFALLWNGFAGLSSTRLHPDDAAARLRRRPAQRHRTARWS